MNTTQANDPWSLAEAWAANSRAVALHPQATASAALGVAYQYSDLIALAECDQYTLLRDPDGYYYAGCRGPFTAEQALKHRDREDDRACLFTFAILMAEEAK